MLRPISATCSLLIAVTAMPANGVLAASRVRLIQERYAPVLIQDEGSDESAPPTGGNEDGAGSYGDSEAAPILPPDVIEPPGCPLDSAPLELIV